MTEQQAWFVGVDVGGTKIHAALVDPAGRVRKRQRLATPRGASREEVLAAILQGIREVLDKAGVDRAEVRGIGLAVPGLIHYPRAMVEAAPNITISGINLEEPLREAFGCGVVLANDTDACAMGEKWVGSARGMDLAVGVFVGTGIGGGIIVNRRLLRGQKYSAAEIGHMVMQMDGPECGCGNRGCLEALASRVAMERDVRQAIADGRKTILKKLLAEDERGVLRSGMLKEGLQAGDKLTVEVMTRAGEVLAQAMLSLRRIFEPDVMILGGGVMEACGDFLMPMVERAVPADPYLGRRDGGRVVLSALGDDAGVLGAAALAMEGAGLDPFAEGSAVGRMDYPTIRLDGGEVVVGEKAYAGDVIVRVNGKGRARKKSDDARLGSVAELRTKDLQRAIKGGPECLLIGRPGGDETDLDETMKTYLTRRAIRWELLDVPEAVRRFNEDRCRRALLLLRG